MTTTTAAPLKLYEHTANLQLVEEWIFEHDEEIRAAEGALPPELAQLLEEAAAGFAEKAERVALMVLSFTTTAAALQLELDRLGARKRAMEKAAESLKSYLKVQLELAGQDKVVGLRATVALQNNPRSVVGTVDTAWLAQYRASDNPEDVALVRVVPETLELDRKAALEQLKAGRELIGLELVQGRSLRIR